MVPSRILHSTSIAVRAAYVFAALSGFAFLAQAAWPNQTYFPVDFKYFWLSGRLWLEGGSPYGPELETLGKAVFPGVRINPFFYPPSWRPISSLAALSPPQTAETVWATLSVLAFVLTAWLLAGVSSQRYYALNHWRCFALYFAAIALLVKAVEIAVIIGQPTPFLTLAAAALIWSIHTRNAFVTAIALTALFLKPQLSICVGAGALFIPFLRLPLAAAIAATCGLTIYGLAVDNPLQAFSDFLHNLNLYNAYPENQPENMSGFNFITNALFGGWTASPFTLAFFTGVLCCCACLILKKAAVAFHDTETALTMVICFILAGTFIMPTHNSDLLVAVIAILLAPRIKTAPMRVCYLIGALFVMRSMSLSVLFADMPGPEKTVIVSFLDTIGLLLLLCPAVHLLWRQAQPKPPEARSSTRGIMTAAIAPGD